MHSDDTGEDASRMKADKDGGDGGISGPGDSGEAAGNGGEKAPDDFEIEPSSLSKEEIRELLEKARAADEYLDKLRYNLASFQNFRKRMEKEKEEWHRYGISNLVAELLPVIDNMEKAIENSASSAGDACITEGLRIIHQMIVGVLEKFGLRRIDSLGKRFDPCFHDAQGFGTGGDPNTVVAELAKGYMLHDRMIRPAKVLVAGPAPAGGAECRPESGDEDGAGPQGPEKGD